MPAHAPDLLNGGTDPALFCGAAAKEGTNKPVGEARGANTQVLTPNIQKPNPSTRISELLGLRWTRVQIRPGPLHKLENVLLVTRENERKPGRQRASSEDFALGEHLIMPKGGTPKSDLLDSMSWLTFCKLARKMKRYLNISRWWGNIFLFVSHCRERGHTIRDMSTVRCSGLLVCVSLMAGWFQGKSKGIPSSFFGSPYIDTYQFIVCCKSG